MTARYVKHTLYFKRPSGTSRGVLKEKETYFLILESSHRKGIGECGILKGLSPDPVDNFESILTQLCLQLEKNIFDPSLIQAYPAIRMGLEMALRSLQAEHPFALYPSDFSQGKSPIPINGLIWMGDFSFMQAQIEAKLTAGFDCIKMKIGAIDFKKELKLLEQIRKCYSPEEVALRVDANGAFHPDTALAQLQALAAFDLHSIEQPIATGQAQLMRELCRQSPLPIALDEELIGISSYEEKASLLDTIDPPYIILKPTLLGGFEATQEWIDLAENRNIDWWVTSALESNVGLNAIAQWTATLGNALPQGLGTGSLYTNNIPCPLIVEKGYLRYDRNISWQFNL